MTIQNATTVALGNISATGTVVIGAGDIAGAVTQNLNTGITAGALTANTSSSIALVPSGTGTNTITTLGSVTRGGAFSLTDSTGLTLSGSVGTNASPVTITTIAGVLALGANSITTTGANT